MADIGVEVGQKMRSAIKAKLTELNCYVDDELPDYIMVMIANKRTKSQMKEDLQLFLSGKTSTFVDWLHIVLKKLKEVHVTNPDVFKKPAKRKSNEFALGEEDMKKVKKEKKDEGKIIKRTKKEMKVSEKSLTDDLPITANKISEARKIVIMQENQRTQNNEIDEDSFDIPLLSEISASNEEELVLIERKIKNVKSRLGIQIESDEDDDCLNIKADPDDLLINEQLKKSKEEPKPSRKIIVEEPKSVTEEVIDEPRRRVHARITFDKEKDSLNAKYSAILNEQPKKRSILDRLGQKSAETDATNKKLKSSNDVQKPPAEDIREKLNKRFNEKEGVLNRLGVMSKVSVPVKRTKPPPEMNLTEEEEIRTVSKEVPSVVKVKPRILPPKTKQANPKLLLKAVAEAQKSIAQTPTVGKPKMIDNSTKEDSQPILQTKKSIRQRLNTQHIKVVLNNYLNDEDNVSKEKASSSTTTQHKVIKLHYANEDVDNKTSDDDEVDTIIDKESTNKPNQKFIVTLDGVEKAFPKKTTAETSKSIVKIVRAPSPIIFNDGKESASSETAAPPSTIKSKERCKFWPNCKQADKCEFVHPLSQCKMFPNCKFADKCLYIHPNCKFETACTRRDCPYSHSTKTSSAAAIATKPAQVQVCKYYPNCSNIHCTYYHPRLCKFGVFCKNKLECTFLHRQPAKPSNLTWRSDQKTS